MAIELKPRFPEAVSPSAWGAIVDYDSKNWTPWMPDKYVIHWGGDPVRSDAASGNVEGEKAQLRSWENFHINGRGWLGIAYNWAIGNSGTLYRLRGDNRAGATRGDYEFDGIPENHEAVAVVFIIGDGQSPSEAALATFQHIWHTEPLEPVIGHRDVFEEGKGGTKTQCPGNELAAWIDSESYKQGETPETENTMTIYVEAISVEGGGDGKTRYYVAGPTGLVNLPKSVAAPLLEDARVVQVVFADGVVQSEWDNFANSMKPVFTTELDPIEFPAYEGQLSLTVAEPTTANE